MAQVGYIGLGSIGAPMARRLHAAFPDAMVFDAVPAACAAFGGGNVASGPAALGDGASFVGICVRDDKDVRDVVAGKGGLLETMSQGIIAVHSTVRPSTVTELAALAKARGVTLIDAAVTGGADLAAAGKLTVMVGGDADAVTAATLYLESYCNAIVHAGALGTGMALKICNNLVTYAELNAALEAYRLAAACGLSADQLTEVMTNNGNMTPAMRGFMAHRRTGADRLGVEAYDASQLSLAHLGEKDLGLAEEIAVEVGVAIPATNGIRATFRQSVLGA